MYSRDDWHYRNGRGARLVCEALRYRVLCDDGSTYTGKSFEDAFDYLTDYLDGRIPAVHPGPDGIYD